MGKPFNQAAGNQKKEGNITKTTGCNAIVPYVRITNKLEPFTEARWYGLDKRIPLPLVDN